MPAAHRHTDARACGATTVSAQNKNVFVNGLLLSINGDPNSHGSGELVAATKNVYVGGILVVNLGDSATADSSCIPLGGAHCAPTATGGSSNVFIGD